MAPFLDPGSRVFENPEEFGYTLRARTLEEHRQLLLQPSWKHILNYIPDAMTLDEMVDATYEAAVGINRVKAKVGAIDQKTAMATERRILEAQIAMARIDDIMRHEEPERGRLLGEYKEEIALLNESTVCEKTELNWPAKMNAGHIFNNAGLLFRVIAETLIPALRERDTRYMKQGS
jgi:hypothetical protein